MADAPMGWRFLYFLPVGGSSGAKEITSQPPDVVERVKKILEN